MTDTQDQTPQQLRNWLHLHLTEGVGPIIFTRLLERFGTVAEALAARAGQLASDPGIGQKTAEKIAAARDRVDVDAELELAKELGVAVITRLCPAYPPALLKTPDPPAVLYVRGELRREDNLALAIVGSRFCSQYGAEQASRFAHLLAVSGFTIVSGLARGIDSAAHRGALAAKGRTIAVQGCGLASVFPPENKDLADQIAASGAVISELPLTFEPLANMFVHRNRIISGLSLGAIIVEAKLNSGALHTAKYATEQNREVMAVPGRIDSPGSAGPHRLLKDGAQLVEKLEDILEALGPIGDILKDHSATQADAAEKKQQAALFDQPAGRPALKLSPTEAAVLDCLDHEAIHIDQIAARTQCKISDINAAVTLLQLKGLIKQLPGSFYQRKFQ